MEKLQAALEKARKQREMAGDGAPPRRTVDASGSVPPLKTPGITTLWSDLTPFTVDEDQLDRYHLVSGTPSAASTHFDILRTKVLLQMKQNNWKRLAITSPMPKSGKTTTACNLAMGLGRQRDLRTILMDTDLRSPSIADFFQVTPAHGIGEVLGGQVDFADQAMRLGENVACSMTRQSESDPARILLADGTSDVLDEIEERFQPDIMIFDLPSMLVSDDTRAFLKNVDCALMVIRANATRYTQFDTCEREVAEHTNILGVVLNAYLSATPDHQ